MKKITKRLVFCGAVVLSSCFFSTNLLGAETAAAQTVSSANNYFSDEIYKGFGINKTYQDANGQEKEVLSQAEEVFNEPDTAENAPLANYETYPLNEMYVGWMNRGNDGKYDGTSRIHETYTKTMDEMADSGALNIDKLPMVSGTKVEDYREYDKDDFEYQSNNTITFYGMPADDNGKKEPILLETFLGTGKFANGDATKDRYNRLMMRAFTREKTLDNTLGSFNQNVKFAGDRNYYYQELADSGSEHKTTLWDLPVNEARGLHSMVAGDFNGDGKEEVAIYFPTVEKDRSPYVAFYGCDEQGEIHELTEKEGLPAIYLKDLVPGVTDKQITNNHKYKWDQIPLVQLSTSNLARNYHNAVEKDQRTSQDLVISLSMSDKTLTSHISSSLAIYSSYEGPQKKAGLTKVYAQNLESEGVYFNYSAAAEGDLNGDSIKELVVSGVKGNQPDKNLLQLIAYEENAADQSYGYRAVFDTPKEVQKHSKLKIKQPIPLDLGRYKMGTYNESIFVGGRMVEIDPATLKSAADSEKNEDKPASQAAIFKAAGFVQGSEIKLDGTDKDPFIHSAVFARMSSQEVTEQLITVQGDLDSSGDHDVYLDIGFFWESGGKLKTHLNNNVISKKDLDDHGTFLSAIPVNVDEDQVTYRYDGKEYGWTKPQIMAILQANPYWAELGRHTETNAFGSTSYTMTAGSGFGTEGAWNVGGEFGSSTAVGIEAGILENKASLEIGGYLDLAANYAGSTTEQKSNTSSHTFNSFDPNDSIVMYAQPIIYYHYTFNIPPEQQGESAENAKEPLEEKMLFPLQLAGIFGQIPVSQYQETAAKANQDPEAEGQYPEIDMKKILGKDANAPYQPGDPTSYQKIGNKSQIPVVKRENIAGKEVDAYYESPDTIPIVDSMESSNDISLEFTKETADSYGFNVDLAVGAKLKAELSAGFIVKEKIDNEESLGIKAGGGAMWTDTNLSAATFSASYPSLINPNDQNAIFGGNEENTANIEDYYFTVKPAVWQTSAVTNGVKENDELSGNPYVIGHLVEMAAAETLPPKPPKDFHISSIGSNAVALSWVAGEGDARDADEVEIFQALEGNLEKGYTKVATVEASGEKVESCVIGNLESNHKYRFKIRSVKKVEQGGGEQKIYGNLQPVKEEFKEEDYLEVETLPKRKSIAFDATKPVSAKPGETAFLKAEGTKKKAQNLLFDWRRYVTNTQSYDGQWQAMEENSQITSELKETTFATQAELTDVKDSDTRFYRVSALEEGNPQNYAISDSIYLTVEEENTKQKPLVTAEIFNSEENPNQAVKLAGEQTSYFLNDEKNLQVKAVVANEQAGGEIAFYGYDQAGSEVFKTERTPVSEQTANETLAEIPKETARIVAVYFDQEYPEGVPSIAQEIHQDINTLDLTKAGLEKVENTPPNKAETEKTQEYPVEYVLDGGDNHPDNLGSQDPTKNQLNLKAPTKPGYEFLGWYYNEKDPNQPTKKAADNMQGFQQAMTFHAKWRLIDYPIFYQSGNWRRPNSNPKTFNVEQLKTGQAVIRNPYLNKKRTTWYTDFLAEKTFNGLNEEMLGNVFLHAPLTTADVSRKQNVLITAKAGEGGKISPAGIVKVKKGQDQMFKFTADEGYQIAEVLIDGKRSATASEYTFKNLQENHKIEVQFSQKGGANNGNNQGKPQPPANNEKEQTDSQGNLPQTGSKQLNLVIWGLLLVTVFAAIYYYRKKVSASQVK